MTGAGYGGLFWGTKSIMDEQHTDSKQMNRYDTIFIILGIHTEDCRKILPQNPDISATFINMKKK